MVGGVHSPFHVFGVVDWVEQLMQTSRRYTTKVSLRYEDVSKIPAICADITAWLRQHEGVDQNMSLYAELAALAEWSAQMSIQVSSCAPAAHSAFLSFCMWP